jgi:hypothetical protein
MPKWIAAVFVSVCLCAPNLALAGADQSQSGDILAGDILGVSKEQALVVGAGILGGALVPHLVIPGDLTYFAGGVVGGLAALWWYENGGESKLRPLLKPDRASAVVTARGSPIVAGLALAR